MSSALLAALAVLALVPLSVRLRARSLLLSSCNFCWTCLAVTSSAKRKGRLMVKVVPTLTVDLTLISPPMMLTTFFTMDIPKPVPCTEFKRCSREYGLKSFFKNSRSIPIPVSDTSTMNDGLCRCRISRILTLTTQPGCEYLSELDTRLLMI